VTLLGGIGRIVVGQRKERRNPRGLRWITHRYKVTRPT